MRDLWDMKKNEYSEMRTINSKNIFGVITCIIEKK